MALDPLFSAQFTSSQSQDKVQGIYDGAKVRCAYAKYTAVAAGTGIAELLTLPAGRIIIHNHLSRMVGSDDGQTNANVSIGHAAYTQQDGTAVILDIDEWVNDADYGGGVTDIVFDILLPTIPFGEYNSRDGIVVTMTVDTADMDLGGVVELLIYYTAEN